MVVGRTGPGGDEWEETRLVVVVVTMEGTLAVVGRTAPPRHCWDEK